MKRKLIITFLMAAALCSTASAQKESLQTNYLGTNNTMVKVNAEKRYLLMPIEEQAPETHINVLLGGNIDQQINVRLAQSKIDYYVPFDLVRYKGKKIVLDISTGNDRTNVRDPREDVCWKEMRLSETFDSANVEKYRPAFHHTPVYGWMNDPNGMFYKDGVYHLYFQHNPYASVWGNMNWGHSTSRDLIHWQHNPVAIAPDGLGAIFSGSAVVDKNNTAGFGHDAIVAIYTSASSTQRQSLSYSTDDGMTFTKYDGNPIIMSDKECRDDKVIWNAQTGKWNLIMADALEHQDWFYSSDDLKHWTKEGAFGQGYGAQGGVWECPDLMQLPVRGTNEKKWVLIVNLNPGGIFGGSATQYFVGDFDGKQFKCDSQPNVTKWMDYGKDHYATVSWSNAPERRHTVIAWMSNWQYANAVPTKQFRSANSLPRDIELFKGDDGEYYIYTTPSSELTALRGKEKKYGSFNISGRNVTKKLPEDAHGLYEINMKIDVAKNADIILGNTEGDKVVMRYDTQKRTFSMDRRKSGIVDFSSDFPCITTAPISADHQQTLRLFIDRSSIEAFDGDGHFVMTNLVFPHQPYTTLSIHADGQGKVKDLVSWNIKY
jgi:fructan beta-fructosidase